MIAALLAGLGIGVAVWKRDALRGTTLTAAWAWLLFSLAALAGVELLAATRGESGVLLRPLRFAAASTTFCPWMALMGAKRPQNRGWHFVVLTFWIMLALPAGETLLLRPGQSLDVHGLRSWFLLLLILLGLANSSLTRFWPSALLYGTAQALFMSEFLPFGGGPISAAGRFAAPLGAGLITASLMIAAAWQTRRDVQHPLDQLWLDFRDLFGLFWGLRVVERVNAAAQQNEWPVRLHWGGFTAHDSSADPQLSPEVSRALRQTLDNLLRRFVSRTWIARRLGEAVD